MRRLIVIVALLALILCPSGLWAKASHHSAGYSGKSHHAKSHSAQHTGHHRSHSYVPQGTKYIPGETYSTTGLPKVERSETAKEEFLREHGYKRVPPGYEVDHIVPLSEGGADTPSNMQLLTKSAHKAKTAAERHRDRGLHHRKKHN